MRTFRSELVRVFNENPNFEWLTLYSKDSSKKYNSNDLMKRVYDFCDLYKEQNVKENDTVLIILKESLDLFASFFAGIIYGALPAYFAYPSPKQTKEAFLTAIDNLIKFNEIKLVISFSEVIDVLNQNSKIEREGFLGFIDQKNIKTNNKNTIDDFSIVKREAFLQFSSGTTGAKKGVKISVEALFNQIDAYDEFVLYNENSIVVSWLPHYHDMGLIACMLMPFLKSIPIVMISPFEWVMNPKMLFEAITKHKGTHIWLPNFALGHLTKSVQYIKDYNLNSLRQLIICSEPAIFETVSNFVEKFNSIGISQEKIFDCYAMAENTFAMTSTKKGPIKFIEIDQGEFQKNLRVELKLGGRQVASAGNALSNIDIKILGSEGKFVNEDIVGEVCIKSNCMLDCYHNNPEETSGAFFEEYFKTGDQGFLHKGELHITGRIKDLIIVGGENIYPQDIELILNEENYLIPGRNAVFGIEDDILGTEKIVILAEAKDEFLNNDTSLTRAKIFDSLMISVSEFILLPHMTLKKGTAGKISRYLNKIEFENGAFNKFSKSAADENNLNEKYSQIKKIIEKLLSKSIKIKIENSTKLISTGTIDSFTFIDLIKSLEELYKITIPEKYYKFEYFDSIEIIGKTMKSLVEKNEDDLKNIKIDEKEKVGTKENINSGFGSFIKTKSTSTGRYLFEQILFFMFQAIPSIFGIGLRGIFYKLIIKGNGITAIEENVQICHSKNLRVGKDVFIGRNSYLGASDGGIVLGDKTIILDNCYLNVFNFDNESGGKNKINVGKNVIISRSVTMYGHSGIDIGDNVMIGPHCILVTGNHGEISKDTDFRNSKIILSKPTIIEKNVWIGANVNILPGITIGQNSVVAPGSLVTQDIPSYSFYGGTPAKLIKKLS